MKNQDPELSTDDYKTWMPEARQMAAQCWCAEETKHTTMDTKLAEVVARAIASWMATAAQNQRNTDYYRGLVMRCGEPFGRAAYVRDDGSLSEDILCAKVPELVWNLINPSPKSQSQTP